MKAVFDASLLLLAVDPNAKPPDHPSGSAHAVKPSERIRHLLERLDEQGEAALVPTPALAEILARAPMRSAEILDILERSYRVQVVSFDERAAIECAIMLHDLRKAGGRKALDRTWAKAKFDHQIVAISKIHGASTIYSDDRDIARLGARFGVGVIGTWDLPLPPEDPQGILPLGGGETSS